MFSDQQQSALQVRENIYLNREKQVRIQKKLTESGDLCWHLHIVPRIHLINDYFFLLLIIIFIFACWMRLKNHINTINQIVCFSFKASFEF